MILNIAKKFKFLHFLFGLLMSVNLHAEPIKLTIFVGGPAGGALDNVARILKDRFEQHPTNSYTVEILNRPGNGPVAATSVFLSNTRPNQKNKVQLLLTASSVLIPIYTQDILPKNTVEKLVPLSVIGKMRPIIHAAAGFPINSLEDIDKLGRPFITYTTPGNSTTLQLIASQIKNQIKTPMIHVPVNSTPNALNMLLGNHVDLVFDVGQYYNMAIAGKTKIISVISNKNWSNMPNNLLLNNQLPNPVEFDLSYYMIFGNHYNDRNLQQIVETDIKKIAVSDDQFLTMLANLNIESLTSAEIHTSKELWNKLSTRFRNLLTKITLTN
jgi:tripartite-type tricarboxylate transporter receptor subunit TctC